MQGPCDGQGGRLTTMGRRRGGPVGPARITSKVFRYDVGLRWNGEKQGVLSCEDRSDLPVASPPEFRGHAGMWTPEHLFVASVSACTLMTLMSTLVRLGIPLASYECDATGTLERAEDGVFRFTRVVLKPHIVLTRAEDRQAVEEAFQKAESGCLVTSSLLTTVEAEPHIEVLEGHGPSPPGGAV